MFATLTSASACGAWYIVIRAVQRHREVQVNIHRFRVAEARRVRHPALLNIEKHYLTVAAKDMPQGISSKPNAREATGMNRQVYRDVRDSLLGQTAEPGTFDLMNKGIVVLASSVTRIDDHTYDVAVDEDQGIVDGGHTYRIISENVDHPELSSAQYVEVQVRTGISGALITDIARGLNTGIQVRPHSLANLDGAFDWIKSDLRNEAFFQHFSWREGDEGEYDVRDILCVMEALNVFDFPNEGAKHPVHAYEKWSTVLAKFQRDWDETSGRPGDSTYRKLGGLIRGGLALYDRIRRDFRDLRNEQGGKGGRFKIVEEARKGGSFDFPFAQLSPAQYRLTKGAAMPILAAFRNVVRVEPTSGSAVWAGGYAAAEALWAEHGPELVNETVAATQEIGNLPDQLGKSRQHWANMHKTVKLRVLERRLELAER